MSLIKSIINGAKEGASNYKKERPTKKIPRRVEANLLGIGICYDANKTVSQSKAVGGVLKGIALGIGTAVVSAGKGAAAGYRESYANKEIEQSPESDSTIQASS